MTVVWGGRKAALRSRGRAKMGKLRHGGQVTAHGPAWEHPGAPCSPACALPPRSRHSPGSSLPHRSSRLAPGPRVVRTRAVGSPAAPASPTAGRRDTRRCTGPALPGRVCSACTSPARAQGKRACGSWAGRREFASRQLRRVPVPFARHYPARPGWSRPPDFQGRAMETPGSGVGQSRSRWPGQGHFALPKNECGPGLQPQHTSH